MFEKLRARGRLINAFKLAGIYREIKRGDRIAKHYPRIRSIEIAEEYTKYSFTLLNGIDPAKLKDSEWIFKQVFGKPFQLDGKSKTFTLTVYNSELPKEVKYRFEDWRLPVTKKSIPVILGYDINGQQIIVDLNVFPHILLSGATGSGKSSLLRAVLVTLIKSKSPSQIQMVLGDMKLSEFSALFRNVEHVRSLSTDSKSMLKALKEVDKEMKRRGKLLEAAEVPHIDDLSEKLPYILVCIDEVGLLQKEKEILRIIEDISSIGRSNGIVLALSMQRPDNKVLDGKLKNNLSIRVSGHQSNEVNSRVAGVPGAHEIDIDKKGRMLCVIEKLFEVQSPHLTFEEAKKLLAPYKRKPKSKPKLASIDTQRNDDIFDVLEESKDESIK